MDPKTVSTLFAIRQDVEEHIRLNELQDAVAYMLYMVYFGTDNFEDFMEAMYKMGENLLGPKYHKAYKDLSSGKVKKWPGED